MCKTKTYGIWRKSHVHPHQSTLTAKMLIIGESCLKTIGNVTTVYHNREVNAKRVCVCYFQSQLDRT